MIISAQMTTSVEIISSELWGHLLGKYEKDTDPRTQHINQAMLAALKAGFTAFADFREGLEPKGFRAVRKYLASMPDTERPAADVVILVAENLLHPDTNYQARDVHDRYDMPGDMVPGEHTFHRGVAAQLRISLWRRDPNRLGPEWNGHVRIRHWGVISPHLQPYGIIPSFHASSEQDDRTSAPLTTVSFPATREAPSETARHIRLALTVAKPRILAGFQGHPLLPF